VGLRAPKPKACPKPLRGFLCGTSITRGVSSMSERSQRIFNETFGKIYEILINDNLTASENIAILAKLINTILERSGASEQTLLRARVRIAVAILRGDK
jgi:hypothetical protein